MFLEVPNPLEVIIFALGLICVLKKVAEMERYHELRIGVLTTLFSLVLLFSYWIAFVKSFEDPREVYPEEDHFTLTEM